MKMSSDDHDDGGGCDNSTEAPCMTVNSRTKLLNT